MRACNAAANHAANVAFQHHTASKVTVQQLCYQELRAVYGISAQMAVRAIAKACDAYRRDKRILPVFRADGATAYDPRILVFKGRDHVSILTLAGRLLVPLVYQGRRRSQHPERVRGQVHLVCRDGGFYLAVVVDVPEPTRPGEPAQWLGVDLGIKHLATDSTGETHTGKGVRAVRYRNRRLRQRLQRKNTRAMPDESRRGEELQAQPSKAEKLTGQSSDGSCLVSNSGRRFFSQPCRLVRAWRLDDRCYYGECSHGHKS